VILDDKDRRHARVLTLSPGACWLFSSACAADIELAPDPDANVEDIVCAMWDESLVPAYVDRLPAHERLVVQLRYGLAGPARSCREVAAYCERSVGWVHAAEHRALDRLRRWYRRDGHWPDAQPWA
jgi:DNA-directed RNA polymerase specialized sigma24 family protein